MTNLRVFKELEDEYPDVEFDAYHITGKGDVSALEERKRRKQRKSKRIYGAAWGPGPYGLYGYDAGYSGAGGVGDGGGGGESRINEAWTPDKKQRIKDFALWAIKLLEIEQAPRIKLVGDSGTSALGYFDLDTQNIVVTVKDRHQMDIMRTLAHELVHRKQNEIRELDGATGSPDENEANSLAGVLLRWWGKKNPEQFNENILKKYVLAEQDVAENFADGRNPQDKGDSKRHGISKGMSIADLKKVRSSDSASPRKKQLAHWQINMRQGKKK
jgi:hypothetical protein